jgi:hypothetical protein
MNSQQEDAEITLKKDEVEAEPQGADAALNKG